MPPRLGWAPSPGKLGDIRGGSFAFEEPTAEEVERRRRLAAEDR